MARPQGRQPDSGGPKGPGPWIVTFSDCMTLLLCFFVMLVTFSSFDEVSLKRLAGAFAYKAMESVSDRERTVKDSVVPPRDRQVDHTKEGSEQPTSEPPKRVENPRKLPHIASTEAYRDKKVLYVPSGRLFWGKGNSFTRSGREYLHMVASFMKLVPCRIVVAEIPGAGESGLDAQAALDRGLRRSWTVMHYFTAEEGLAPKRFHISATRRLAPARFGGQPVMEITLLARDVYE